VAAREKIGNGHGHEARFGNGVDELMNRKWLLSACALAILVIGGLIILDASSRRVRRLNARYAAVVQGMSRADVIRTMGELPDFEGWPLHPNTYWDDRELGSSESKRAVSAITYRRKMSRSSISFEFTFDREDKLIGKHRYD
jgi:hypothetical protein